MVSKWPANGASPGDLRKVHRALVLRELYQRAGTSRIELAGRLGLSSMAVGRIVRELHERGLVRELDAPAPPAGRGRPATGLALAPDGAFVAGVVISAFSQEVRLLDLRGETVAARAVRLRDVSIAERAVAAFCDQVADLVADAGVPRERVAGAGFAVAAHVDSERGAVIGGGYLGWRPIALGAVAERRLGCPVTVHNLADTLLKAETFAGCARGAKAAALIHCATILGASLSSDGQLLSGARFQAGRIGHFPSTPTTLVCSCGRSDCLNCTASAWSVLSRLGLLETRTYRTADVQRYSHLTRALIEGELPPHTARADLPRLLAGAGSSLAGALHVLGLAFDPDRLVLAGPLAANDTYFDAVLARLDGIGATDLAAGLARSALAPSTAAGVVALLELVFSPALALDRFDVASPSDSRPGARR